MTEVPLLTHVEKLLEGVHTELRDLREENRRDHEQVTVLLEKAAVRVDGVETRVDTLESERDARQGAEQVELRQRRVLMDLSSGIVIALVSAAAGGTVALAVDKF